MRKTGNCFVLTLATVSLSVASLPLFASAQALVDDNIQISSEGVFPSAPAVAANPVSGEFLVVWDDAPGPNIFAQLIGADGTLKGENFPVTTARAANPDVAFNTEANEFLVVYQRAVTVGSPLVGIFGQRVTPDGLLLDDEFPILTGSLSQINPAVAYNPVADQYLVVWNQSPPTAGVRGQIVGGDGTPISSVLELSPGLIGAVRPAVAVNASGQYLVVWDGFSPLLAESGGNVFGRLVNASGTVAWDFFPLTTAANLQFAPAVTFNPVAEQFFVVWSDSRMFVDNADDIFGQLVNANGSLAGQEVPISTSPSEERSPTVAHSTATNRYLVVWTGGPPPGTVGKIFGRLFGPDGSPLDGEFQISTAGTAQFFTDLALNPLTNLFLSVWPDDRNAQTSSTDIFGQLITLAMHVEIDIKPGGEVNSINPKSRGKIPVAILSKPGFDAPAEVDQETLRFGRTGNERSLAFCNKGGQDVNGDGLADLMCHFHTQDAAFGSGVNEGVLKGETLSGAPFTASDSVRIVPPHNK